MAGATEPDRNVGEDERQLAGATRRRDTTLEMHLSYELGTYLSQLGRTQVEYRRGLQLLERALELAGAKGDARSRADILINVASNYYNNPRGDMVGNKARARDALLEAQKFFTADFEPETWAMWATNEALCLLFLDSADNTRVAADLLERARRLRSAGSTDWAYTTMHLGLAYRKLPATSVGEHVRLLKRSSVLLDGAASAFENHGMIEASLRGRIQAISTRLRAIRLAAQIREVGELLMHAGMGATKVHDQKLDAFRALGLSVGLAAVNPRFYDSSSNAEPSTGLIALTAKEGAACHQAALQLQGLRALAESMSRHEEVSRGLVLEAEAELMTHGATRRAVCLLYDALERTSFRERPSEWTEWAAQALGVCCEAEDFETGAAVARSIATSYGLALGDVESQAHGQALRSTFPTLTRLASRCLCGNNSFEAAAELIENGRQHDVFGDLRTFRAVVDTAAKLSACVCYLITTPRGVDALFVHPDGSTAHRFVTDVTSATIAALHLGLDQTSLGLHWAQRQEDDYTLAIERSLEHLQPIAQTIFGAVADGTGRRCVVIGTGLITGLPLLQCDVKSGGTCLPLNEAISISWAPSAAALSSDGWWTSRTVDRAVVLGNPHRDDLSDLPSAEVEARMVAAHLTAVGVGVTLLEGDAAAAANLTPQLRRTDVVHVAGHGCADPLLDRDNFLCLADGDHTFTDLGFSRSRTALRIAVLSACQTGLHAMRVPEEVSGLAADLVAAGTACVVASLWTVRDDSTALLMARFYELMTASSRDSLLSLFGPAVALAKAQQWLRELTVEDEQQYVMSLRAEGFRLDIRGGPEGCHPYESPLDWAAFVTWGV